MAEWEPNSGFRILFEHVFIEGYLQNIWIVTFSTLNYILFIFAYIFQV